MGILLRTALRMSGRRVQRAFDRATRDPQSAQTALLMDIVRSNQDSEYGQEHGFSLIAAPDAFCSSVPINTFADLSGRVERMRNGETNVLTSEQPILFNVTSGTTDRPKYVPFTAKGLAASAARSRQWLYRAMRDHPTCLDHSFMCITGAAVEGRTESGVPYGSASGMMYESLPRVLHSSLALPFPLAGIGDYDVRYYVMARLGFERDVSLLITPNPMTLVRLAETGVRYQDDIIRGIRNGVLCENWPFERTEEDAQILAAMGPRLRPNPRRAAALEQAISSHGRLLPSTCWNHLTLIGCWLGGSIGFQARRLSEYFGGDVPLRDLGYLASEGSMTIPCEDDTPAGILALHNNYYEFIPSGESAAECGRTLQCHELDEGREYKVILTNHSGLYRYDIHDIVEVKGYYNRTPLVAFVRKGDDMLNVTGEKLHVNQFIQAFQRLRAAHGLSVKQFRVVPNRVELRHELLVDIGAVATEGVVRSVAIPFVDKCLSEANMEYAAKRKSGRLHPPCMHIMSESWAEAVRQSSVAEGQRDIQYKWRSVAGEITELDAEHILYSVSPQKGG